MDIIMFGAGASARILYDEIAQTGKVVAFADNDMGKWGKSLFGAPICNPEKCLNELKYDRVVISAFCGLEDIRNQCIALGVPPEKIVTSYFESSKESRKVFLKNLAPILNEQEQEADVAEAGVYQGGFSKWINYYFPNRTLHLFDTFEGFDPRDLAIEQEHAFSSEEAGHFRETSVDLVMAQMPYPEQCKIHKGYFPDTAVGLDRKFCFVNLDLDLYLPLYRGLHFFKDKMTDSGIILVHDYFSSGYKGAQAAVETFLSESGKVIRKYPIGDNASVMLTGNWGHN